MFLLGITIDNPIRGNRIKQATGSRRELCGSEEAFEHHVVIRHGRLLQGATPMNSVEENREQ